MGARAPYREVEQLLSSGGFQVLDGADPVQALLQEELRRLHGSRTVAGVHQVQTAARQLEDRTQQLTDGRLERRPTRCSAMATHSQRWDEMGQTVPQVGVVPEGVVGEEGRHGGT